MTEKREKKTRTNKQNAKAFRRLSIETSTVQNWGDEEIRGAFVKVNRRNENGCGKQRNGTEQFTWSLNAHPPGHWLVGTDPRVPMGPAMIRPDPAEPLSGRRSNRSNWSLTPLRNIVSIGQTETEIVVVAWCVISERGRSPKDGCAPLPE